MNFYDGELVSIITPLYNSEKYILDTIDSVLKQTYKKWEMIIIDDASPDNSNKLVEEYLRKDNRIKLIKLVKNVGPAKARNEGIKQAKGKYIAFLDSDDIWLPKKLEKQVKFMEDNNLLVTCSSYYTIDENNNKINTRVVKKLFTYSDMLKSNHIGNLTGIYDCEKLGKVYMDNVGHEDYTLWLKIMKKVGTTKAISEPLAEYRILTNSISANKIKSAKWTWSIYRNIVGLSLARSTYYFFHYLFNALKKRV
ncbi:glycosyltransferase [Arcobacter lacus]|uniref:glycosyltransferase family 2 protein n=1 Tax=Arcobacter lacus TaxID=1912876 RepID=UPI0021BAA70E|nr:glycosyltransferase family 2 protein [Arcobacter lacus]MCG3714138.1 glycosyltransferase [Aliarcobacter butzleri]MCT7908118.1 glycosyltransferase [Arcobacter lacus]